MKNPKNLLDLACEVSNVQGGIIHHHYADFIVRSAFGSWHQHVEEGEVAVYGCYLKDFIEHNGSVPEEKMDAVYLSENHYKKCYSLTQDVIWNNKTHSITLIPSGKITFGGNKHLLLNR